MDSYSVAEAALGVCLRIHPKGRVVTRVKSIGALALMLFPLLGCSSPAGPSEDSPRIDPSWIVDSLRDGVSADGLFRLADVREFPDEATRQEGGALAVAIVKFLGSTTGAIREYVETTHGAAIEFDKLFPCGRIVYVVSPFNPVKSETASAIRNVTGGAWVQPMCLTLAGPPVMLQYVAARARVRVVGGVIGGGPLVGNEFYSVGVPKAAPTRFVQTPERAAQRVFMRTNTRIAKVPDLLHDQYYIGPTVVNGRPLGFLWIFTLERPVTVIRQGQRFQTSRFYVVYGFSSYDVTEVFVDGPVALAPFWERFGYLGSDGQTVTDSVMVEPRFPLSLATFELAP